MMNKITRYIILLGIVLRLPGLVSPMWYDEQFSLILARLPIGRIIQASAGDVHPPLTYIIMSAWALPNLPEWIIRIPSFIASVLAMFVMLIIMRQLSIPERASTAALLLMAISPFQLYHANEARHYAIFQLIMLVCIMAALDRKWWLFTLTGIAAMYTINYGAFYLSSIAITLAVMDRKTIKPLAISAAVIVLAWLPWVPVILQQTAYLKSIGYWIPDTQPGIVLLDIYKLIAGMVGRVHFSIMASMLIIFSWLIGALGWLCIKRPASWWPVLMLAFMPMALSLLAGLVTMPVFLHRPLIATTPFLFIILAYPIEQMITSPRWVQLYASILIIPILIVHTANYMLTTDEIRTDVGMAKVTQYLQANWQEGDAVFNEGDGANIYFRALAPQLNSYAWKSCQPFGANISPAARKAMGIKTVSDIEDIPAKRVWIVKAPFVFSPDCELQIWDEYTRNAEHVFNYRFDNMTIDLYLIERNAQ